MTAHDPAMGRVAAGLNEPIRLAGHSLNGIFDSAARKGEGFLAFLPLNHAAMQQLIAGQFDASNPDLSLVTAQHERPAGIYVWAAYAPGVLVGGVPLAFEKVWTPTYRDADLFSRGITVDGDRFLDARGFARGASYGGVTNAHMHMFRRSGTAEREQHPLYDSYRGAHAPTAISVTVARTIEDIMRIDALHKGQRLTFLEDASASHGLGEFDASEVHGVISRIVELYGDVCSTHSWIASTATSRPSRVESRV